MSASTNLNITDWTSRDIDWSANGSKDWLTYKVLGQKNENAYIQQHNERVAQWRSNVMSRMAGEQSVLLKIGDSKMRQVLKNCVSALFEAPSNHMDTIVMLKLHAGDCADVWFVHILGFTSRSVECTDPDCSETLTQPSKRGMWICCHLLCQ